MGCCHSRSGVSGMSKRRRHVEPFEALIRHGNLSQLLDFFTRAEERLTSAFPRASRALSESNSPSAKQVRGSTRRHYLHEALLTAARDVKLPVLEGWTEPATWSFPVVKAGAFSLTIGIVETKYRGAARTLRSKGKYIANMCERNAPMNPQSDLFKTVDPADTIIPDASLGALVVAQFRPHQPDVPAFLGFMVPSEKLNGNYCLMSFEEVITRLRDRLSLARRPAKKVVLRKPLRRRVPKSGDKQG
jgi:hypothetical protein